MTLDELIARSQQGDPWAIARLISRSLAADGVVASASWQSNTLIVLLEADGPLDRTVIAPRLRRGFLRLQLTPEISVVRLSSRRIGQDALDWSEEFILNPPVRSPDGQHASALPETSFPKTRIPDPKTSKISPPEPIIPEPRTAKTSPPKSSTPEPRTDKPRNPAPAPTSLPPPTPLSTDTALATLCHLTPLFAYLLVLGDIWVGGLPFFWASTFLLPWRAVVPLLLLLTHADASGWIKSQVREALNFQLSMMIYWMVTLVLMFILVGWILAVPLAIAETVLIIQAAVKAGEGGKVRYPLTIRFVN